MTKQSSFQVTWIATGYALAMTVVGVLIAQNWQCDHCNHTAISMGF